MQCENPKSQGLRAHYLEPSNNSLIFQKKKQTTGRVRDRLEAKIQTQAVWCRTLLTPPAAAPVGDNWVVCLLSRLTFVYIFDVGRVLENLSEAFQKKGCLMVAINDVFGLLKHLIQGGRLNLKPSRQK